MHGLQMCVRKISGSVEMWGPTRSSLLQSQIFYVYRPRAPAFRYVPIVRGSGVSEQGVPLFGGLSDTESRIVCPLASLVPLSWADLAGELRCSFVSCEPITAGRKLAVAYPLPVRSMALFPLYSYFVFAVILVLVGDGEVHSTEFAFWKLRPSSFEPPPLPPRRGFFFFDPAAFPSIR